MSDLLLVQFNDRQEHITHHYHLSSFLLTDTSDVSETGGVVREELKIVTSIFNSLTDNRKLLEWFLKEKEWVYVHNNKFLIYAFQQGYWDYVDSFIKEKKLSYEDDSDYEIEENGLKICHHASDRWTRLANVYRELCEKYHHKLEFEL